MAFECLEDRPRRHRCLTLTPVASQLTPRRRPGVGSAARRASKTFRPTNTPKKLRTRRLRHEPRVEFSQGARVVDPAFGMGCRVRHPNILTSRERSGYPIYSFPAVRRIATLSARAVRAARTGAAAVRTDGICGNGGRADLVPPGLREPFDYPGTSGAGNPGRLCIEKHS